MVLKRFLTSLHAAVLLVVMFLGTDVPARAATPLHKQIDQLIEAKMGGKAAGPADDAEFLRRVYLDLTGIIPTEAEARAFLAYKDPEKRTKLIDRLLASPEYARRMREVFTVMLLERRTGTVVPDDDWNAFLESSFARNKPWDVFVRELFEADAGQESTRGAVKFFVDGGRADHDQLTQDVARLFLGMNIHCAKCHDHPTVDQFKQADYYGLLAFLQQSKPGKNNKLQRTFLVESPSPGKIEFQSVFFVEKNQTGPRLPGGEEVAIPTFEKGKEFAAPAKDGLPAVPVFQPRRLLASQLTRSSNRRFVKNSVNRFWFLMMGRGLVEPLDMLHNDNPASHPQLLETLADEFVAHGFDVKWLLRELALSKTYQRSGRLPEGVGAKDVPPTSYRVAVARGLSAEQRAWSMMRATGVLDRVVKTPRPKDSKFNFKDYVNERVPPPDNLGDTMLLFVSVFGNPPGEEEVEFHPSMGQALFLQNEKLVLQWLKPAEENLVGRLVKLTDAKEIAEGMYLNILSRFPTEEETADIAAYLEKNRARRDEAIGDYAWALVTSTEFALNH